jgi:hypothetical protein
LLAGIGGAGRGVERLTVHGGNMVRQGGGWNGAEPPPSISPMSCQQSWIWGGFDMTRRIAFKTGDAAGLQRQRFSTTPSSDAVNINSILATNLDADGFHKCLMVNHVGDTRANEWYTEVEGLSIDPTSSSIRAILTLV